MPIIVLVLGIFTSVGAFVVERGSVGHSNQLLLRQDAVQGSLIMGSLLTQTPATVSSAASRITPSGLSTPEWNQLAGTLVNKTSASSAAALVRDVSDHFVVVHRVGPIHSDFASFSAGRVLNALSHGASSYVGVAHHAHQRWLTVYYPVPAAPGSALYLEEPVSTKPYSLSALPGHPFSGINGAIYAGRELPQDLLLATTATVPLRGQRAVTVIGSSSDFSSNPVSLSTRVGSLADPGHYVLVVSAASSLSGTTAANLPWILLVVGLGATLVVAALIALSESRRARVIATLGELAERNADLDRAVDRQQQTAARFSAMVRSSSDLTTVITTDGLVTYQSPASTALLGASPEALVGSTFPDLIHPDDVDLWHRVLSDCERLPGTEGTAELRLRTTTGSYVTMETRVTNLLTDPAVEGLVLNSRDMTDHKRLEDELRHQAFHDSLTGLANRALFEDRLENALDRLPRSGGTLGVLFLDLDDFKAVNDGRGHRIGDELLRAVSDRLRATTRAGDTLARIGGDEFAVLVEGDVAAGAIETSARILDSMKKPFVLGAVEVCVGVSIGVVTTSHAGRGAQELLRDADVAMYAAKNAGKGRVEVFHPGLHQEVIKRLQLEIDLGRALDNDQLAVYYQALVNLVSGQVYGVEALMRWEHPTRGLIMPDDFIPVAESTGLIVPMGAWLLHRACSDVRTLQQEGKPDLHLSVNLSARQLEDPHLVSQVHSALQESGLEPQCLTLEITESVFMVDRRRSQQVLERLKELGVRLSIDDFGTGYSSLSYLRNLPVDELKIDRSFIAAAADADPNTGSLVHVIVRLAQDFGLETVAEGIETEQQLGHVREVGCTLGQGFLFARPVPLSDVVVALKNMRVAAAV